MGAYAVSDLHGCFNQWRQIQSFCKDSDRIYVLGDCIDRLANGFNTLKSVLNDPRTTMLLGNHEEMMLHTLIDYFAEDSEYGFPWFQNDGYYTFTEWVKDGRRREWITVLENLPLYASYTNDNGIEVLMNHAGTMPKIGYPMSTCPRKNLLWDRNHNGSKYWNYDDNQVIIHGHTPIPMMPQLRKFKDTEIEPGAFWYCDEHRCNIDNGSCWTGYVCLLDLNTWEEHIFYGKV